MSLRAKKWAIAIAFMLGAVLCVGLFGSGLAALAGWHASWMVPLGLAPWLLIVGRMVAEWVCGARRHGGKSPS
ncbi:putative membrane protein AbrB (regulator of aidB expression) [Streptacidiphilus sp. MAP12-33]|uniref:hypothetical protein n=1 Tax=Streptacidiphilus sp. MAP12-33 TaxID=3156266 RepID=UPI00351417DA